MTQARHDVNRRDRTARRKRFALRVQRSLRFALVVVACGTALAQEQAPRFKSTVEVTSIDVTVIDDRGKPIQNLTPADFTVRVDGKDRRVVTAEWVPLVSEAKASTTFVPEGYSSNENSTGGRLIVIAVDQPNIRFGGGRAVTIAAEGFIDRLSPADRIAVTGFGLGAPVTSFTSDRARVKMALSRMTGQKQAGTRGNHQISLAEAGAIGNGDRSTLQSVQERECGPLVGGRAASPGAAELCRSEVESEAAELAVNANHESDQTLRGIRDLLTGLKSIAAPKTLILISEGFVLDDMSFTVEVGSLAAVARTSVYALRLDAPMFDVSDRARPTNAFSDRETRAAGLETLVGAARGMVVNVAGSGASFFERLESELSGYYLLGVESDPRDRDGKPHPVKVDVPRRGTTVRTRRQFISAADDARPRSPRDAVTAGLSTPLLMSALPLRVASFALQGPERGKIQLLIHADVGTEYTNSKAVSIGYMLFDHTGRLVDSQSVDARIPPIMNGVPSPLQYRTGASVVPGEYTLKLAVAEGDKVGSIEHPIHAVLADAGRGVTVSELMVGGPIEVDDLVRPTIGYTVSFGNVHGYIEAYAPKMDAVKVKYELAADATGPALLSADVPGRPAGEGRALFSRVMSVQQLPAGKYVMRAIVLEGGTPVKTLARAFEVAPPAVLMTSAEGVGTASTDAELFLPVGDELLTRPFRRDDAVARATVQAFRERVPESVRPAFDTGISLITAGEYPKAEAALKRGIQPEIDSTASLVYLAVCFAASGHDTEAASVWQTALVDGSDFPQIYEWLGGALMRSHDLTEARTVYEEAVGKWPADARFTKPLAMLYATFGRGREAVRTLERYLSAHLDDRDALFLGVEWIYNVRAAGGIVHGRAQDAKLAREYADAYAKTGGPQAALVKQWVEFLEKK